MISNYKTSTALVAKAQAFADLHGYRLAKQGAGFTPLPDETYLKESFLANKNEMLGVGFDACIEQKPIYQIDVYTPKDKGGKFPSENIGDLLMVEFKRAPIMFDDGEQTVQIENSSSQLMRANETHNWTMVQVDLVVIASNT